RVTLLPASRPLFVDRQLGRRESREPLVRNRLSALDREAVRSVDQALLGSLDGGELSTEIVLETLVELVLVEIGCEIRRVVLVGRLAVILVAEPPERVVDPLALGGQELACPICVHGASVTIPRSKAID